MICDSFISVIRLFSVCVWRYTRWLHTQSSCHNTSFAVFMTWYGIISTECPKTIVNFVFRGVQLKMISELMPVIQSVIGSRNGTTGNTPVSVTTSVPTTPLAYPSAVNSFLETVMRDYPQVVGGLLPVMCRYVYHIVFDIEYISKKNFNWDFIQILINAEQ